MRLSALPAGQFLNKRLAALFGETHWWPLTENATDMVGGLKVSAQAGALAYTTFNSKQCINFPRNAWFEIPAFSFGDKWSLSTWYSAIDYQTYHHLFATADALANDAIMMKLGALSDPQGMPYLFSQTAGKSQVGKARLPRNQWTLVTFTYEAGVLKLYVNDVLDTTFNVIVRVAKAPFRVGGGVETNQSSYGYQRDIRVWDRAIDLNTIKQIVAKG